MINFWWDAAVARYRYRGTGRFVKRSTIVAAFERAIARDRRYIGQVTEALRDGSITLDQWTNVMRRAIKNVHLYSAAAARGGFAQLTAADYGRVGAIVRSEYGFLRRRVAAIEAGRTPLDGRVPVYARQYMLGGRETFYEFDRIAARAAGFRYEWNVLHPADHCVDCVAATARSPAPVGTLPKIGARQCRRHCRCTFRYSRTREG